MEGACLQPQRDVAQDRPFAIAEIAVAILAKADPATFRQQDGQALAIRALTPAVHSAAAPRISVLMSVLGPDPEFLRAALRSVLEQTLDDLEIVLLEDPAETSAADVVAELNDPRLRHVQNPARVPLPVSRMQTLELARADLVAIMDADDICEPSRLEQQCAFLHHHQDVDVVGTQIAIIDNDDALQGYRAYPLDHRDIVKRFGRFPHRNAVLGRTTTPEEQQFLDDGGFAG